ncbi:MAG: hypothetical protein AAF801_07045 [Pseudomonadota bacterium]
MSFHRIGGLCALICAATYLFGFAFLVMFLMPFGYGTAKVDAVAVVDFIAQQPGALTLFNCVIYILNALALAVLVVVLAAMLHTRSPAWASVTRGIGLIWAALVLGAGMIGNVAIEQSAHLAIADPEGAAQLWQMLHSVELGLGGGNEIAGGIWIAFVSLAGHLGRSIDKATVAVGLMTGIGGLLTLIPSFGDIAGAIFGLGAIVWFIAIGVTLARASARMSFDLMGKRAWSL